MENTVDQNPRYSITFEVIRYVTLYYFSIAILLTVGQVIFEYYDIKKNINFNVNELISSFNDSLTNSLWEFNDNQTKAILTGIVESPSVIGVRLTDINNTELYSLNIKSNIKERLSPNNISSIFTPNSLFQYKQELVKILENGKKEKVGMLYIYSGNKIILEQLSRIIFYIIVNSVLKTISLWAILIIFFNRKVKKPLNQFVKKITSIDSQNPVPIANDVMFETEEIYQIQFSFNKLIKELKNFKDVLEAIVENKTELLKEKNIEVRSLLTKLEDAQTQIVNQEKLNSLGLVSAGIAHELKNPLNLSKNSVIIIKDILHIEENGEIDLSKVKEAKVKTLPSVINMLLESNQRMESIITNMLLQSRSEYTKPTEINLHSFITMNLRVVQKSLKTKASAITKVATEIDEEQNIDVFPNELGRLLVNLFENAFFALSDKEKLCQSKGEEYTPELNVLVKKYGNNKILLTVHDNGIGIPHNIRNKILEPFFTTKPTGLGTGLGLYLSYEIVKKHHGEIVINSEEKVYTEIQITLPLDLAKHF
jgi:signal transduction histidine kinase